MMHVIQNICYGTKRQSVILFSPFSQNREETLFLRKRNYDLNCLHLLHPIDLVSSRKSSMF